MLTPAAIGAGIAAGLLGIGGGMIIGPVQQRLSMAQRELELAP